MPGRDGLYVLQSNGETSLNPSEMLVHTYAATLSGNSCSFSITLSSWTTWGPARVVIVSSPSLPSPET